MSRRHHRDPHSLDEFIDATVDHLEEYWGEVGTLLLRPWMREKGLSFQVDKRGKLAQRPLRQLPSEIETAPKPGFRFRIRLEITPE